MSVSDDDEVFEQDPFAGLEDRLTERFALDDLEYAKTDEQAASEVDAIMSRLRKRARSGEAQKPGSEAEPSVRRTPIPPAADVAAGRGEESPAEAGAFSSALLEVSWMDDPHDGAEGAFAAELGPDPAEEQRVAQAQARVAAEAEARAAKEAEEKAAQQAREIAATKAAQEAEEKAAREAAEAREAEEKAARAAEEARAAAEARAAEEAEAKAAQEAEEKAAREAAEARAAREAEAKAAQQAEEKAAREAAEARAAREAEAKAAQEAEERAAREAEEARAAAEAEAAQEAEAKAAEEAEARAAQEAEEKAAREAEEAEAKAAQEAEEAEARAAQEAEEKAAREAEEARAAQEAEAAEARAAEKAEKKAAAATAKREAEESKDASADETSAGTFAALLDDPEEPEPALSDAIDAPDDQDAEKTADRDESEETITTHPDLVDRSDFPEDESAAPQVIPFDDSVPAPPVEPPEDEVQEAAEDAAPVEDAQDSDTEVVARENVEILLEDGSTVYQDEFFGGQASPATPADVDIPQTERPPVSVYLIALILSVAALGAVIWWSGQSDGATNSADGTTAESADRADASAVTDTAAVAGEDAAVEPAAVPSADTATLRLDHLTSQVASVVDRCDANGLLGTIISQTGQDVRLDVVAEFFGPNDDLYHAVEVTTGVVRNDTVQTFNALLIGEPIPDQYAGQNPERCELRVVGVIAP